MKAFLLILTMTLLVLGGGAFFLALFDSIVPLHGYLVALGCGLFVAWYFWKGKYIGK